MIVHRDLVKGDSLTVCAETRIGYMRGSSASWSPSKALLLLQYICMLWAKFSVEYIQQTTLA